MTNPLLDKCFDLLKREDVKREIKNLTTPLLDMALLELRPYIYVSFILVIVSFLLHLGIFCLLLRRPARRAAADQII